MQHAVARRILRRSNGSQGRAARRLAQPNAFYERVLVNFSSTFATRRSRTTSSHGPQQPQFNPLNASPFSV